MTGNEIMLSDRTVAGDIYIGAAETDGVRFIARAAQNLREDYPLVHFHISSGDTIGVIEDLDKGLIDFGLLFGEMDTSKYDYLDVPFTDTWGVLMRRDSPLAVKESIDPEDLLDKPIIVSRQAQNASRFQEWMRREPERINVVATYSLLFNGSLMVAEGIGYALCLDKIINVTGDSNLCFKPFTTTLSAGMSIVWKKYQVFTKAAENFLLKLQDMV